MSMCNNCLYHTDCDAFHWGALGCDWYAPLDEDYQDAFETHDDRDEYYKEYVEYISEFDEDFLYE